MKFIRLILPLVLLGLFSLKLSQGANLTTVDPDLSSSDYSNSDTYSTPEESYSDSESDYGGPKRFSGNIRYTAVRRIRKSGTGIGAGVASRRGNRKANRSANRRGNRNGNRNRNRRGRVNRNKKRQAAKGRSNGKRRANNRRGASVVRLG